MEITKVDSYSQLAQCLAIRNQVFVEEQGVPQELENDAYDTSPDACVHVLLTYNGVPAGTGRWISYNKQTAKIQRVAILSEFRGKGLGKILIQGLEQHAISGGYTSCILDSQCHAEAFYSQLGYNTISEQPFEDAGILHVRMQKKIG
ncbi:Predicted N-acyltransferase, GNAT family [Paenibacillus sp. 1_12]|uniref:GNAT family N-acetyltransferase n=1 Tax=Paenibacillus sp. 1_12 TaxID=1566278 RepID=UPI0008E2C271|nr:GNAT family N-acetyltransferase [Paenibacillus sp. 1_12]SFK71223.1 Predicted N-acyltransferase, GNAT family [Paenibacillus sp. 1_12]